MLPFQDHFSTRAAAYAAYRPRYPAALFDYAAALASDRDLAWDCATGSGQAALGLVRHFTRVVATDASAAQLAHAVRHERVDYCVALAEASALAAGRVRLVTVSQALHWLDAPAFFAEARRVLAPGGALAVWCYGDPALREPALDGALGRIQDAVNSYWPPGRRALHEGYRSLPFPFDEVAAPSFTLEQHWTLRELTGYMRTWSATMRYAAAQGRDPVEEFGGELTAAWGEPSRRRAVYWAMSVRAGFA